MESYTIKQLNFSYPNQERQVLKDICLSIQPGQFVTLCGTSGCGKTTLLRQLKPSLASHGEKTGEILFQGRPLEEMDLREQSEKIGFVLQSPDNQIVTDKVWHELAFGLESLGYDTKTIRLRVAEMASFFGIQGWFYRNVSELSGGQKQLLNLAAIMAMQPSVLILDEPTSQLDPIAASDFLATVGKINRELGTTVIMTEHRLEQVLPISDRLIVMEQGRIIADGIPKEVGQSLAESHNKMFSAMPIPMQVYANVKNTLPCPITVREGREWLTSFFQQSNNHKNQQNNAIQIDFKENDSPIDQSKQTKFFDLEGKQSLKQTLKCIKKEKKEDDYAIEIDEAWFKYEKDLPDIIKGVDLKVKKGEFFALLGGNGTGKSTTLSLIAGIFRPYRGTVKIQGRLLSEMTDEEKFQGLLGVLPQNPQTLFVKKTVELDLYEMLRVFKMSKEEKKRKVDTVISLCDLKELLQQHPYDLSGGEQQRVALAKILLLEPEILLLDEPTKGLDADYKKRFASILGGLKEKGITIIMVSHDVEFCANYAERCALFFDGGIVTGGTPREFFKGNNFYTTEANRMARHLIPNAITASDVIAVCNGESIEGLEYETVENVDSETKNINPIVDFGKKKNFLKEKKEKEKGLLKQKRESSVVTCLNAKPKISKRTLLASLIILLWIPLTIFIGVYYLNDRKYYFISMLIILETMLPFLMIFEDRKPQAKELIVISVLCAIGVAGRGAFFMLPHFKPVVAVVMIAGVAFGAETGFLVGAVTGFASNIFFGQGPWTPWQMFGFGIIGFLTGFLFQKNWLKRNKKALCAFGGFATFFIYGGILNPASVIMHQPNPTMEMILLAYLRGIPCDLVHATSTVFFLYVCSQPMLEKLDRIKVKYGLIEEEHPVQLKVREAT